MKLQLSLIFLSTSVQPLVATEPGGSFEGTLFQIGSAGVYVLMSLLFGRTLVRKGFRSSDGKGGGQ